MTVRRAAPGDVDAIHDVARASWTADYPDILSRETAEDGVGEWYTPARLRADLDDPRTRLFVAVEDDAVVGFAHALVDDDAGHLLRLYVHPDARRGGVGAALVEAVREELACLDADRVTATVLAANEPGNAFYRDLGFEKVGEGETSIGGETFRENRYERPSRS
jgi:ribosomal protein S18 acetylase RimI-like enzyme